jgi:hypothetical protein
MSRAHAEIAYQIARLGRLITEVGDRAGRRGNRAGRQMTSGGSLHVVVTFSS